jgi:hypothetical protein
MTTAKAAGHAADTAHNCGWFWSALQHGTVWPRSSPSTLDMLHSIAHRGPPHVRAAIKAAGGHQVLASVCPGDRAAVAVHRVRVARGVEAAMPPQPLGQRLEVMMPSVTWPGVTSVLKCHCRLIRYSCPLPQEPPMAWTCTPLIDFRQQDCRSLGPQPCSPYDCGSLLTHGLRISGVRRVRTSCGVVSQLSGSRAAHRRLTCALLIASTSAGTSSTI